MNKSKLKMIILLVIFFGAILASVINLIMMLADRI